MKFRPQNRLAIVARKRQNLLSSLLNVLCSASRRSVGDSLRPRGMQFEVLESRGVLAFSSTLIANAATFSRSLKSKSPPRIGKRLRHLILEQLENRVLYAIDLGGVATWVEQGPGPSRNGQTEGIAINPVTGSVQA